MFLPEGMISSSERIFHVPENGVDPLEGRMFDSLFSSTDDMRFVDASSVCDSIEAAQTVRNNDRSRLEIPLAPLLYFVLAEALDLRKLDPLGLLIHVSFYGRQKRSFPACTASSFSRDAFATEIRIVNLNPSAESFHAAALKHDLHELVFDTPGSIVGNTELPGKLQRGNTVFILRQ